jgi:Ca2+-binding EF-hand superfamily protein
MPDTIDFAFDMKYSGIEISTQDIHDLEEFFMKYQSTNSTIIKPREILKTFKKHNIDTENPSMYSMMKWISDANSHSGTEGMTFDEVIQYIAYFYS